MNGIVVINIKQTGRFWLIGRRIYRVTMTAPTGGGNVRDERLSGRQAFRTAARMAELLIAAGRLYTVTGNEEIKR